MFRWKTIVFNHISRWRKSANSWLGESAQFELEQVLLCTEAAHRKLCCLIKHQHRSYRPVLWERNNLITTTECVPRAAKKPITLKEMHQSSEKWLFLLH